MRRSALTIYVLAISLFGSSEGQAVDSISEVYDTAAIAIDGRPCAQVGMDVLRRDGTAVDAAVAALLCNGLFNAHSMGVGGGFFMTVYLRETGEAYHLNSREMAPHYASDDMYEDDPDQSRVGPMASGIPGQIVGMWEAKERFGNPEVTWASLFQPSIDMCREGVEVGSSLASALRSNSATIKVDPGLSSVFVDPETGEVWQEGDSYTCEALADTMERIAANGVSEVTEGQTAEDLIADIQAAGGMMDMGDLQSFQAVWEDPLTVELNDGMMLYSNQPPGSGAVLAYIVNTLQNYDFEEEGLGVEDPVLYQRVGEAFKWAYARRTEMGDPYDPAITDFINELVANMTSEELAFETYSVINDTYTVNDESYYGAEYYAEEDHGTSHTSILAPNGDAVAITSTINTFFGCEFMSPSTGIIMNDEMDDFSFPNITNAFGIEPSPNNFPIPGKRPQSSMAPEIVVGADGDVRLISGASGGTAITTAIAWVTVQNLWLGRDVEEAVDFYRLHHQLTPMEFYYEEGLDQDILDYLESVGHVTNDDIAGSVCNSISFEDGLIQAVADGRKDGAVDGISEGDASPNQAVKSAAALATILLPTIFSFML